MSSGTDQLDPVASLQRQCDASPFIRFAAIRVLSVDMKAQTARFAMPFRPEFERGQGTGQFHGGPIASLIDTAGCMALMEPSGELRFDDLTLKKKQNFNYFFLGRTSFL